VENRGHGSGGGKSIEAEVGLSDQIGFKQAADVKADTERLPTMGVADGVLVLVEALDSALRHVLRDTKVTVPVTDASAGQSYAVDLRRRVLECRCVRRELKVQPHFRGPEFIEQVRREDVHPI